jgi:hypothetical protein
MECESSGMKPSTAAFENGRIRRAKEMRRIKAK